MKIQKWLSALFIAVLACAPWVARGEFYKVITYERNMRYVMLVDGYGDAYCNAIGVIQVYTVMADPFQAVNVTSDSGTKFWSYLEWNDAYYDMSLYFYQCCDVYDAYNWGAMQGAQWIDPTADDSMDNVFPTYIKYSGLGSTLYETHSAGFDHYEYFW
ncbi:MAG: hypothetical protein JWM32_1017 [Verrucomicrobia bacterium]|nr:hypothetical protein [Verrucomicrobiota bacterium]